MSSQERPPQYLSFLLRFWLVQERGQWVWRASLESPLSDRLQGFSDLRSLFDSLNERLKDSAPDGQVSGQDSRTNANN